MKKENGFIKFLLVLIVIALAGIIMLFGYVMYNEFAGNGDVDFGNLQLIYPKIENQESGEVKKKGTDYMDFTVLK